MKKTVLKIERIYEDMNTPEKRENVSKSTQEPVVSEHDWHFVPPVSLYDSLYWCAKCGAHHMESVDSPADRKPRYGCTH